jgi:SAM-dependent methyltransferase
MLYRTGEVFRYFLCGDCGCIQIAEIPKDLQRYYPDDYPAFRSAGRTWHQPLKPLACRAMTAISRLTAPFGSALRHRLAKLHLLLLYDEATCHDRAARILDVGSGGGDLLKFLIDLGYRNVSGIDAYIAEGRAYRGRLLVRRADIFNITGEYDVISFHHSLEHVADQDGVLAAARRLLASTGCLLVRIPVVGGAAWERYRELSIGLDPPRHLYLHSLTSFAALATRAGLRIASVVYDDNGWHFWAGELHRRGISVIDPRAAAVFSAAEQRAFKRQAQLANRSGRGDQIAAILLPQTTIPA